MKILAMWLVLISMGCQSEEKIGNTVEARLFLANQDWDTGTRDRIEFTDQDVVIKKPSVLLSLEEQKSMYAIEKRTDGDSILKKPYFEIKWFDNDLNQYRKFLLCEDGRYAYLAPGWRWNSGVDIIDKISHIPQAEAIATEKHYKLAYDAYDAARIAASQPMVETSAS